MAALVAYFGKGTWFKAAIVSSVYNTNKIQVAHGTPSVSPLYHAIETRFDSHFTAQKFGNWAKKNTERLYRRIAVGPPQR
jgi:hypothetical protein